MASTSEYRGLGLNGGEYINDTAVHNNTKGWFAIQATEDTVIQAQSSNITNLDDIANQATICYDKVIRIAKAS